MKRGEIGSDIFLQSGLDDPNQIEMLQEITVLERTVFEVQEQGKANSPIGMRYRSLVGASGGLRVRSLRASILIVIYLR